MKTIVYLLGFSVLACCGLYAHHVTHQFVNLLAIG